MVTYRKCVHKLKVSTHELQPDSLYALYKGPPLSMTPSGLAREIEKSRSS